MYNYVHVSSRVITIIIIKQQKEEKNVSRIKEQLNWKRKLGLNKHVIYD